MSITGVLGGHHMPIEEIVAHLKPLHAPLGVYAVLGNHDRWENGRAHIAAVLTKAGIPDFENAHIVIRRAARAADPGQYRRLSQRRRRIRPAP